MSHCTYGASCETSARPETASTTTCERMSYCHMTAWSNRRTLNPSLVETNASSRIDLHACSLRWNSSSSAATLMLLGSAAVSVTVSDDQETWPCQPCQE